MQKSSWIVLTVCAALAALLGLGYVMSRAEPEPMTPARAEALVWAMEKAVEGKKVATLMSYVGDDEDIKVGGLSRDRLRLLLAQAFRNSGSLDARVENLAFAGGQGQDATLDLDLTVNESRSGLEGGELYKGHIKMYLRRVEVPRLFGLYRTREWKITGATQSGRNLEAFGDL